MTDSFFVCVANDIKPLVIARSERSERRGNLCCVIRSMLGIASLVALARNDVMAGDCFATLAMTL